MPRGPVLSPRTPEPAVPRVTPEPRRTAPEHPEPRNAPSGSLRMGQRAASGVPAEPQPPAERVPLVITIEAPPDPQPPRPMPMPLRTERLGPELVSPEQLARLADVGRSPGPSPLRTATRRPEASARTAPAARAAEEPPVRPAAPRRAPAAPEPPPAGSFLPASPETVDASVILPLYRPGPPAESLPSPARPLNGPLVLGALSLISAVLVPLCVLFEGDQVFGILGFCLSGFFLPFAPIAWIAGLAAERRRREQGLRSETRVLAGRLLGQWGTVILVVEASAIFFLVAVLRLAGKLPVSFNVH